MADKSKYSIWEERAIMSTLMTKSQPEITNELIDRFFLEIKKIFKTKLRDERDALFYGLSPAHYSTPEILEKYKSLIATLDPVSDKSLLNKLKDDTLSISKMLKGKELYLSTKEK